MAHLIIDPMAMKRRNIVIMVFSVAMIMTIGALIMFFKPHTSVKNEEALFKLSVSELVQAFEEDESKANGIYGGKILEVRGPLKEVIVNDSSTILLMGDSTQMAGVSCYLQNDQKNRSKDLRLGEDVIIKGICNGMLLDVVMDKCLILSGK